MELLEDEIAITLGRPTNPPETPDYDIQPPGTNIDLIWSDWFFGGDAPSIWKMNSVFNSSWRKGWSQVKRQRYSGRKRVIELVLKEMLKSKSEPLATRMQHGLDAAFDIIVAASGVNKYLKGKGAAK